MKKVFGLICLSLFLSAPLFAQNARTVAKEMRTTLKKLPLDAQIKVLESAKREVTLQESLKKAEIAAKNTETVAPKPPVPPKPPVASVAPAPPRPAITVTPQTAPVPPSGNETKIATAPNPAFTPAAPPAIAPEDFVVKANSYPATSIKWDSETFDFGKITEGDKVTHRFKVTNTGKNPLYIVNVKPSCGCTSPVWTKDAIAPGNEGIVDIEFNSSGKSGTQSKTVMITTNTDPVQKSLKFTGEVVPNPAGGHNEHDGHQH